MPVLSDPVFILLALGSNLGHRRQNLRQAVRRLREGVDVERLSPVYETAPWGVVDQPDFLNLCLSGRTRLAAEQLLPALKAIEQEMGRQPAMRYGPRLIDIDLLFYGQQIIDTPSLTVPHPRLAERAFVLAPLAAIAPDFRHPASGLTVRQMLSAVDSSTVTPLAAPLFPAGE